MPASWDAALASARNIEVAQAGHKGVSAGVSESGVSAAAVQGVAGVSDDVLRTLIRAELAHVGFRIDGTKPESRSWSSGIEAPSMPRRERNVPEHFIDQLRE